MAYLSLPHREALYGGAAGGGKSDALLMGALQYAGAPGYAALLLRRTYADLSLPEALIPRSHEWLAGTDAHWHETTKTWTFPSGATLTFGYLQHKNDKYRYQSSAFQYIGFDELTQFEEEQYRYLFSRLRRLEGFDVPLRMRAATNPGGVGHEWVYERFVVDDARPFLPAKLEDNPYIDEDEYVKSLGELDEITLRQLLDGEWITDPRGKPFQREWWRGRNRYPIDDVGYRNRSVARYLSFDTGEEDKETSAYTACTVAELLPTYELVVRRVWRDKILFPDLPDQIEGFAREYNQDGKLRGILIEDKSSGKQAIQTLSATAPDWIAELIVPYRPQGDKMERGKRAAVWCKRNRVWLPHPHEDAYWLNDFEHELFNFPETQHADQVDSLTQLVIFLEYYLAAGWHGNRR